MSFTWNYWLLERLSSLWLLFFRPFSTLLFSRVHVWMWSDRCNNLPTSLRSFRPPKSLLISSALLTNINLPLRVCIVHLFLIFFLSWSLLILVMGVCGAVLSSICANVFWVWSSCFNFNHIMLLGLYILFVSTCVVYRFRYQIF